MNEQLKDLLCEYLGELLYDQAKRPKHERFYEIKEQIKAIELLLKPFYEPSQQPTDSIG